MKRIKNLVLLNIVLFSLLLGCHAPAPSLSDFDYQSASVLPFYNFRRTKYAILSRERWGRDKGTYDDFGGKRDPGENHPVVSAAREFWEEAVLDGVCGLTLQQTQHYIDIAKSKNTHYVIANTTTRGARNVTYITNFNKYKNQFINDFYKARRISRKRENKEKDSIALVKWHDLKTAIISQRHSHVPVYVMASVVHPVTNRQEQKQILLRPYLVIKLRSFFKEEPYVAGKNKKIRFYS